MKTKLVYIVSSDGASIYIMYTGHHFAAIMELLWWIQTPTMWRHMLTIEILKLCLLKAF